MRLYCLDPNDPDRRDAENRCPIQLELDHADERLWDALEIRDRELERFAVGEWITVTDGMTGQKWDVRTAPCGLGCRCAAEARPHES